MARIPKSPPLAPDREKVARRIAANVRRHWQTGHRANELGGSINSLVTRLGINANTLRKNRRFARLYSETELQDLLAGRRPNGLPLHWGYVIYLITIPDRKQRRRLEQQALREGWEAPRLAEAVQQLRGIHSAKARSKVGGRPVKVPQDACERLYWLAEETGRWRARYEALQRADQADLSQPPKQAGHARSAQSPALRALLVAMDAAAHKLERYLQRSMTAALSSR